MKFLLALLFIPVALNAQIDNIELPDIELTIEDHSSLDNTGTEEALIRDRNPDFHQVYLEELAVSAANDASISTIQFQKSRHKFSFMEFLYGSYNDTRINAFSQNVVNNLFYKIGYRGQLKDNTGFNGTIFPNTTLFNNMLDAEFTYTKNNAVIFTSLQYHQRKMNFTNNQDFNQNNHYVPINFWAKYWVNDISYIKMQAELGLSLLQLQNLESISTGDGLLVDTDLSVGYFANLAPWNYFTFDIRYAFNHYSNSFSINTAWITLTSDFKLGKGFSLMIGGVLVTSSFESFFGWPEIKLAYDYLNIFSIDAKVSGDFNLYNAERSFSEQQFFQISPTKESKWVYGLSLKVRPSPLVWFGALFDYNSFQNKRIYQYNTQNNLYQFLQIENIQLISVGVSLGSEVKDIFDIAFSYVYENIPSSWLLYPAHKMDFLLGLGYKPVGFWFQTRFTLYSPRLLLENFQSPVIPLWNMKFTQKIYKIASLSLEFDNILNQNIQFVLSSFYGGFQVRGGFQLNF
ncbi:MAG: hypothetical protein ACRCTQ_03270 [Brevinemataceae bacterium]